MKRLDGTEEPPQEAPRYSLTPTFATPWDDRLLQCPFCPCRFLSGRDLKAHTHAFGALRVNAVPHLQKFRSLHQPYAPQNRMGVKW